MTTSSAEVPLSVIWGKETVDVTLVVGNGVPSFKKELEELTGVPSDRMKLMPKSKGTHYVFVLESLYFCWFVCF
jgi:hypothetical protein